MSATAPTPIRPRPVARAESAFSVHATGVRPSVGVADADSSDPRARALAIQLARKADELRRAAETVDTLSRDKTELTRRVEHLLRQLDAKDGSLGSVRRASVPTPAGAPTQGVEVLQRVQQPIGGSAREFGLVFVQKGIVLGGAVLHPFETDVLHGHAFSA